MFQSPLLNSSSLPSLYRLAPGVLPYYSERYCFHFDSPQSLMPVEQLASQILGSAVSVRLFIDIESRSLLLFPEAVTPFPSVFIRSFVRGTHIYHFIDLFRILSFRQGSPSTLNSQFIDF